jgi:hypothetical protein
MSMEMSTRPRSTVIHWPRPCSGCLRLYILSQRALGEAGSALRMKSKGSFEMPELSRSRSMCSSLSSCWYSLRRAVGGQTSVLSAVSTSMTRQHEASHATMAQRRSCRPAQHSAHHAARSGSRSGLWQPPCGVHEPHSGS